MPQSEERGEEGKGLRKFWVGPRVTGRVWTEVAIDYERLRGGKEICERR